MTTIRNNTDVTKIINEEITHLHLQCDINTKSMKYLSEAIKDSQTLTHLYLECNINTESMKYLSKAIKNSQTLIKLILWYDINVDSTKYLSKAIEYSQSLTQLDFCDINVESMKYLSKAIQGNQVLTCLCLSYEINLESMKYLNNAIKASQTLKRLEFQFHGEIDVESMKDLSDAIKVSQTIIDFYTEDDMESNLMECINKSLEENKIITKFKNACKNNHIIDALDILKEYNEKCYPIKASNNIINEDAIYWILKNKMTEIAKELIIKCNVMKRLYHRGSVMINLIENDI